MLCYVLEENCCCNKVSSRIVLTSKGISVFFWIFLLHEVSRHFPTYTHTNILELQEPSVYSLYTGILQEIRPKICRHFKSANTSNKKRCRIQMDARMQKLLPDLKRIPTTGTNTMIPRPSSQLYSLHRCIKIRLHRHTDTT